MQTITIPLNEFLTWSTSHGETPIPEGWAVIIAALTQNSPESGFYVQTTSFDGEKMVYPVLWRYGVWESSQSNHERRKAYSQRQREIRFIFEENVKQVIPYIQKFFGVDKNIASIIATKYVRDGNVELLKSLGIDKLIEDIKDV